MSADFFSHPILNSPYEYPGRHWELDSTGQPTQTVIDRRRPASFVSPIPKARGVHEGTTNIQATLGLDEGLGLSTAEQQYELTATLINDVRRRVDEWRQEPDPSKWRVTSDTARLLQHWRNPGNYQSIPRSSARSKPSRPPSGSPRSRHRLAWTRSASSTG